MSYPKLIKSALIIDNIQSIMANMRERLNYTFRIDSEGNSFYLVNGHKVPEKQFLEMYSIEGRRFNAKDNPDKTRVI